MSDDPICDCDGPHYCGIKIHWDQCATNHPNEPKTYLISQRAADNVEAFRQKYGRMPYANEEAIAAMLHGADAESMGP